jgi:tetratricopeptide (TPR) repeat protein
MLTGDLVRVRVKQKELAPSLIRVDDEVLLDRAAQLLEIYQVAAREGWTRGQVDEALRHFDAAQRWYRDAGQTTRAVQVLSTLGTVCGTQGKVGASLAWFDQAIALASEAAHREAIGAGLERVIEVLLRNGYPDIAQTVAQRGASS